MTERDILRAGFISFITCTFFFAVIAAACAGEDEKGYRGLGHAEFHNFYGSIYNVKKDVSCCHDKDCRPTTAKHTDKGWEVMINGAWYTVKNEDIIPKSAPDGGAHVCAGDPSQQDPLGRVYCVIVKPES